MCPTAGASVPHGVVVWLHGPGGFDWKKLLADWKPLCDRYDLILVAPKSSDPGRWMPGDVALVDRLLAEVTSKYDVDPARVVVHGYQDGGALAFLVGLPQSRRDSRRGRGRSGADGPAAGERSAASPGGLRGVGRQVAVGRRRSQSAVKAMREMKIPVVVKSLGATPRYLNAAELAELVRWIDTLDRM